VRPFSNKCRLERDRYSTYQQWTKKIRLRR